MLSRQNINSFLVTGHWCNQDGKKGRLTKYSTLMPDHIRDLTSLK